MFKKKPEIIEPPPCKHKYQDFPAYLVHYTAGYNFVVKVIEPYVCIYCKERRDEVLVIDRFYKINKDKMDQIIDKYQQDYSSILKPRGIVEDMVRDYMLVDREWIDITMKLRQLREENYGSK